MNAAEPENPPEHEFGAAPRREHELESAREHGEARGPRSSDDERRRAWRDLGSCALVVLVTQLATVPLGSAFGDTFGPLELGAIVLVAHGGMLAGTLAILRRRGERLADLGCARPTRGWPRTILLAVPALILMWLALMPLGWLLRGSHALEEQIPIASASFAWIPMWLAISCVVGFVEELVFRGLVLRRLTTAFASPGNSGAVVWANVVSSLGFGLLHGLEPAVIAVTATIGLYLALVTRREGGNLILAMLVHAAQDTVGLTLRSSA
ncbi:MAG: CPBP family intramembrane metalloprotease [Planctomycetes bacterium]|nr:CPBP family intramembrane metalloprotease [Planctomycetota bacterium]